MLKSFLKKAVAVSVLTVVCFTTKSQACAIADRSVHGLFRLIEPNGGIADIRLQPVRTQAKMIDYVFEILSANELSSFKPSQVLAKAQKLSDNVCAFGLYKIPAGPFSQPFAFTTVRPVQSQNNLVLMLQPLSTICMFHAQSNTFSGECGLQGIMIKQ